MPEIYIGTSGWAYNHWQGIFYPKELKNNEKLNFYSKYFKTAEINYSFYHLPRTKTYQSWYSQVPKDFLFAIKISRFITHIKRLKEIKKSWEIFFENAINLKEKTGPFLLQLPPTFKCENENLKRLEKFLKITKEKRKKISLAVEIRHKSFKNSAFFNLLKKYNTALVISDSPSWIKIEKPELADFVYIRMHGSKKLFSSSYTKKELENLAKKIKKWQKERQVFVYFNNDAYGFAVKNALTLKSLIKN